ncbi:isochorismate synthase MenF [Herbiconiux sp. L3-i23]|uniref:isochorismate synthase n=1 Tax=Herbiconiux sp. L3-i23 TaxID=2905871 RepID=UPI0020745808|nr:isochorismate synthase [Herbiconiux sp. L3-i23]
MALPDTGSLDSLLRSTDPAAPLAWLRGGEGFVGVGEAVRWEFSGASRFDDAAEAWRALSARSTIDDPLHLPGTGLVAFGSFAFSPTSSTLSTLIVPRIIFGRRGGRAWLTRITVVGETPAGSPALAEPGTAPAIRFTPGRMAESAYSAAVAQAVREIEAGRVEKVVLARDLRGELPTSFDLRTPLERLATSYPDCWTFAVDGLIGSSPEMLVRVDSGTVQARVLAGSSARGVDAASDSAAALALVTSDKDHDEHGFALRSVLAALTPHTSSLAASDVPFALKLPNLWHLASDVEGVLSDRSSSLDLLRSLHPTAAVAGTPTAVATATIDELEPFDRGRYAGPVGWLSANGDGEWAIALRCAQVDGDTITAYAGAGVVAGSEPERELAETAMKFRPIVEAFG